jgi:hypothetical protein
VKPQEDEDMRRTIQTAVCLLTLALAGSFQASATETRDAPAPAATKGGSVPAGPYYTHYKVRFLDSHAAEVLAWQQCPPDAGDHCRVSTDENGALGVIADAETQRKVAQALAREDSAPFTQAFQFVLLLADSRPGDPPVLTKNAQKAVDDLRGFFPYKAYHLLDTAWARSTGHTSFRLVGKDGMSYSVGLNFTAPGGGENPTLNVRDFRFEEESSPALHQANRPARTLLSTSFALKVGETLVVGTSKLDGGEALVLLVTALPPG